ncbi:GAF domain-containing protein [Cellulomonas fengjieae]|uniref:GAF domain-containing protein n=1 Tax=Cellulomonas fengjieae TaxID=2819978 RepID=UPI001AAE6EF3|nr:GAF domain-containing protein [Cellulomonas fengjieae]MBO3102874.1 GAF domain-containing protein [Cellulomonas fengjieae]
MSDYRDLSGRVEAEAALAQWCLGDFALRAAAHLGTDSECSITLRRTGHARRAASSSHRAGHCDDVENQEHSGGCIEAMDEMHVVLVPDLALEDRWHDWTQAALTVGFRSAAAFPSSAGPDAEIAFNVYSERVAPWTRDTIVRADMYAQQIGLVMGLVLNVTDLQAKLEAFQTALAAQAAIDQAIGAMMQNQGCTADEGLTILRSAAGNRNVDLPHAAAAVLGGLGGGRDAGGPPRD